MSPAINGAAIFGRKITQQTDARPRAAQAFQTFGEDGTGQLDGGGRGTEITLSGELVGASQALLAAAQFTVRAAALGQRWTFTDAAGRTWPDCLLSEFEPYGRVSHRPGSAEWCQRYRLKILSLGGINV